MIKDGRAGWDAKAISRIAKEHYNGLEGLFKAHRWSERGAAMMPAQQSRVVQAYGDIASFMVAHHPAMKLTPEELLDGRFSIMLTSFWGWSPETWGTVGFTNETRRNSVIAEYSDPFVVIVYVTKNAPRTAKELKGYIAGFYLVSHIAGDRDEFTHKSHHERDRQKWRYSLKAMRSFSFVPEYRLHIDTFDPTVAKRAQSVAQWGERVSADRCGLLTKTPFVEVPVFGANREIVDGKIHIPKSKRKGVRGGPVNRSGYWIDGVPFDTEKELYVLKLVGAVDVFLGEAFKGREIFKIGLSMSPLTRRAAFNKTLPGDEFSWKLYRSTRMDREDAYPNFEAALAGEDAMKEFLNEKGEWMGGEFYVATPSILKEAWKIGREAALKYQALNEDV